MEALLDQLLWRPEYWLPPGITWGDMEMSEGVRYPLPRHLLLSLPLALGFIGLRVVFERLVAFPLSRVLGVKDKIRVPVSPIPGLEGFYKQQKRQPSQNKPFVELMMGGFGVVLVISLTLRFMVTAWQFDETGSSYTYSVGKAFNQLLFAQSDLISLAKQCDLPQRHIEAWFRRRRNQDRPSSTKKFCEACWRFTFYLLAFGVGLAVLIDKPWFWDQTHCWIGYPQQPLLNCHYWYYMIELGFYWSLLLCISVDVKRKDFKEQVIHHIATIFLISFSYCANYIRVGALVMLVHDSSDFLLESAKMFNYANWKKTCDTLFVIFAVVFLVSRLVVFPCKVIHTTLFLSMEVFQPFFGYYFFNFLLLVLQALHVFWAWLILRMVYKFVFLGKVERDERSDEEESSDDSREEGGEPEGDERWWEERRGALDSKLTALADSCVLNNLTNQRSSAASRMPKAR